MAPSADAPESALSERLTSRPGRSGQEEGNNVGNEQHSMGKHLPLVLMALFFNTFPVAGKVEHS